MGKLMPTNTLIDNYSYDNLINNFNENLEDIKLNYNKEMKELGNLYNESYDNIFRKYKELTMNLKENLAKNKDKLKHKLEMYNKFYPSIEKEYNTNKNNSHNKFLEDKIIITDINSKEKNNKIEVSINEYNNIMDLTKNKFINKQEELNNNI